MVLWHFFGYFHHISDILQTSWTWLFNICHNTFQCGLRAHYSYPLLTHLFLFFSLQPSLTKICMELELTTWVWEEARGGRSEIFMSCLFSTYTHGTLKYGKRQKYRHSILSIPLTFESQISKDGWRNGGVLLFYCPNQVAPWNWFDMDDLKFLVDRALLRPP